MQKIILFVFLLFLPPICTIKIIAFDRLPLRSDMPEHPRLLMQAGEEKMLLEAIFRSTTWQRMHGEILQECDRITGLPLLEYKKRGMRLLATSREALRRIFFLSYAYRLTGNKKYADRAITEMLKVSSFTDWNPSHFLDVAEMTMAVSIGYDWLFEELPENTRSIIKKAIMEKGLETASDNKYNWYLKAKNNWNQVCNAGILFGAFAVYEASPAYCDTIINRSITSVKLSMQAYSPEGAYPEGYTYWEYGTTFNIFLLEALQKIYHHDFGLSQTKGFMDTAAYFEHMTAPSGKSFNYADCGNEYGLAPAMFWFAKKKNDPSLLWFEKKFLDKKYRTNYLANRFLPVAFIWGASVPENTIVPPAKNSWSGNGLMPVAMMRTSWTDPEAIYVGLKGGTASSNHAHMDAGSFIMEANGVRWAMDFGSQDYASLESHNLGIWKNDQDSERWKVFRYTNYVHNTPTINRKLHKVNGKAEIRLNADDNRFIHATTDLSSLFGDEIASYRRGIALVDNSYVVVKDELYTLRDKNAFLQWTMLTPAKVKVTGKNTIKLEKNGKELYIKIVCDIPVKIKTESTQPPEAYDAPNPGTVLIRLESNMPANRKTDFTVFLLPGKGKVKYNEKLKPLIEW